MPLLEIKNLVKRFPIKRGLWGRGQEYVHAVSGVSFSIEEGKTLGLVGESGSGKSTLGRMLLRLLNPDAGEIIFEGEKISTLKSVSLKNFRKKIQMIFQDPYSSLNPRMTVAAILTEGPAIHRIGDKSSRLQKAAELLQAVGLSPEALLKYPHEFSGGQRQRIGVARALSLLPKLIVCDEPVSALDVSIQAQMINLLQELKEKFKLTYLFISHDLKVVSYLSDQIVVLYLGKIMEYLPADRLMETRHPYTQALLEAVPLPIPGKKTHEILAGEIPSTLKLPSGCVFHTRCPYVQEVCKQKIPVLRELHPNHQVACHLAEEIFGK